MNKTDFYSSGILILFYNAAKFTSVITFETANDIIPFPCICNITEPLYFREELSKILATVSSLNKRNELRVTIFGLSKSS